MSELFLSTTKQDFDGTSSSRFTAYANFTSAIGLFIILPILSERLHIHDALTIAVVQVSEYIFLISLLLILSLLISELRPIYSLHSRIQKLLFLFRAGSVHCWKRRDGLIQGAVADVHWPGEKGITLPRSS